MKTRFKKPWNLPRHNGWLNRPTWAIYTWLSNDEDMYILAKRFGVDHAEDYREFGRKCLGIIRTSPVAMGDINPSDRTDRADQGLMENVDWAAIREALCG